MADCYEPAPYKAPKSPDSLNDYHWFCLPHVQQYNKKWNYFDGMEREDIEDFMQEAVTGHRPTWKREEVASIRGWQTKLEDELEQYLFGAYHRAERKAAPTVDTKTREALALLGLEAPASQEEIKQAYRSLVKKFHPDLHQGSKKIEEKFKQITEAYQFLKLSVSR